MNVKPQTHDLPKLSQAIVVTYKPLPEAKVQTIAVRDFYPPRIKK